MSCINPNDPKFKSLLARVGNPLLAELEFDKTFFQQTSSEGIIASEKTLRDLGARMSDRIGIPIKFISDRSQQFKGKLEDDFGRSIAVVNLAYATLDTPIHEILGHPIIRAIKSKQLVTKRQPWNFNKRFFDDQSTKNNTGKTITHEGHVYEVYELKKFSNITYKAINFKRNEEIELSEKEFNDIVNESQLYQNLLKELEIGRGKEVLDRIKKDYPVINEAKLKENMLSYLQKNSFVKVKSIDSYSISKYGTYIVNAIREDGSVFEYVISISDVGSLYTEEQQKEEAIVELLGLYTAGKLNNVRDGKLISLLKRLLKEMKAFMRELLGQKEVEIDKLPDNMTLGDIADLLAYSNSKLILPGNEVIYTTPDNQRFKTYAEASNHISELAKMVEDVDLSNVSVNTSMPDSFEVEVPMGNDEPSNILKFTKENEQWYISDNWTGKNKIEESDVIKYYQDTTGNYFGAKQNNISSFIEKNKEFEQSKEIIEEWKKVNNIQYNPEEIYSRGQGFYSAFAAYSNLDLDTLMANILQHIEDNEKAGGKFALSAFTKPVDKTIKHIEKSGLNFVIFPQPQHIMWAANTDVFSGSVWDASEKVNKDKKSELLGVSYTKYPALNNVTSVQPNLASVVDNLAHHHNEIGIQITGNNFRLEINKEVLNETDGEEYYKVKAWVDKNNSILDQKYGKLVKPEINKITTIPDTFEYWQQDMNEDGGVDRFRIQVYKKNNKWFEEFFDTNGQSESVREITYNEVENQFNEALASNSTLTRNKGIQPTQTNETLKIKIQDIKIDLDGKQGDFVTIELASTMAGMPLENDGYMLNDYSGKYLPKELTEKLYNSYEEANSAWENYQKQNPNKNKEYTSQALINSKIAKLKEVAKKYPRSLITSEVKLSSVVRTYESEGLFDIDDLPFQKIPSTKTDVNTIISKEEEDNKMPPPCGI